MKYPPDIEDALKKQFAAELDSEMKNFLHENPNASEWEKYYHEYYSKYMISWYLELPRSMSHAEIRKYLGIPCVKDEPNIPRHGWTIAEMIELPV